MAEQTNGREDGASETSNHRSRFPWITTLLIIVVIGAGAAFVYARDLASDVADGPIHPSFDIDATTLIDLVSSLPGEVRERIAERPWYFLELLDQVLGLSPELVVLVDKEHALRADYIPADLVDLTEYDLSLSRPSHQLRRAVMPDLLAMNESARIEGIELMISSTYRSYEYQAGLYQRNVDRYGREQADRESAQPGKSEHQLGTTIDFGSITDEFAETRAGRWLFERGWEYGFSLSYPDGFEAVTGYRHEIWHYRYVGRPTARLSVEYFGSVTQFLLEFLEERGAELRAARIPAS